MSFQFRTHEALHVAIAPAMHSEAPTSFSTESVLNLQQASGHWPCRLSSFLASSEQLSGCCVRSESIIAKALQKISRNLIIMLGCRSRGQQTYFKVKV